MALGRSYKSSVSGFNELSSLFKELPKRVNNKILQKATREGMKEALPTVKQAAPRNSGNKKSKASQDYGPLNKQVKVRRIRMEGNRRGTKISTGTAFYGYILDKGSRYVPAKPWFDQAFESKETAVIAKFKSVMDEELAKAMNELYRTPR